MAHTYKLVFLHYLVKGQAPAFFSDETTEVKQLNDAIRAQMQINVRVSMKDLFFT